MRKNLTRSESRKLAVIGRENSYKKNLKLIHQNISKEVRLGKDRLELHHTYITSDIKQDLLNLGYILSPPKEGKSAYTIYWGYEDDKLDDLFTKEDEEEAFT